jgi:hypothetical protein
VLQLYHGNTSLLRIFAKEFGSRVELDFGAYASRVREVWPDLRRHWAIADVDELSKSLREMLPTLAGKTEQSYYRNMKEGFWENRLSYLYGRSWMSDQEWLILDRQAVIGFASESIRASFYQPVLERHTLARQLLFDRQVPTWSRPKSIGDELDLLAINRQREIVCIELKHKSNSDLHYGPFQAAIYRDAFMAAATSIAADLERLARQKIALGLLPAAAANLFPIAKPIKVGGILAVVGRPSTEVQRRMETCLQSCVNIEYRIFPEAT